MASMQSGAHREPGQSGTKCLRNAPSDATTQDVTRKKRAEEALRTNEAARLQALIGSIDEIVFEFDAQGTYLNIWTRNERLLAFPIAPRLGRTIGDIFGEEFARPFLDIFARVLKTGVAESIEYCLPVRGELRWRLGRINPVPSMDSKPGTICFLARDITDRKQAEMERSGWP